MSASMLRQSITDVTFALRVLMEIPWEGYKLHCVLIWCQEKKTEVLHGEVRSV